MAQINSTPLDGDLSSLLDMITTATHDAVAEYKRHGHEVPSLDSTSPHPIDEEAISLHLRKAIRTLEAACYQLCTTLAPSTFTLVNRGMMIRETTVTSIAVEARLTDALRAYPDGLPVSELSKATGIESGKLARILRALTVKHIYREVSPDVFANNRLSILLASDHPISALLGHWYNESLPGEAKLYETLVDPIAGPSYDPAMASFARTVADPPVPLFDYYATRSKASERFGKAMIGFGYVTDSYAAVKAYPWAELPTGTTVCDVGGGIGAVLILLAKEHAHLSLTLQDLPNVIRQGEKFWHEDYPQAIDEHRINFLPFDFLEGLPALNQDIYYVKQIFHDWPDASCQTIIRNIRAAMKPGSRLLIHDYILQTGHRQDNDRTFEQAPEPLLPTWGAGNSRLYLQDINMMSMLNAKERTIKEFVKLGEDVGLVFVKVWDFVETGMVEFVSP